MPIAVPLVLMFPAFAEEPEPSASPVTARAVVTISSPIGYRSARVVFDGMMPIGVGTSGKFLPPDPNHPDDPLQPDPKGDNEADLTATLNGPGEIIYSTTARIIFDGVAAPETDQTHAGAVVARVSGSKVLNQQSARSLIVCGDVNLDRGTTNTTFTYNSPGTGTATGSVKMGTRELEFVAQMNVTVIWLGTAPVDPVDPRPN